MTTTSLYIFTDGGAFDHKDRKFDSVRAFSVWEINAESETRRPIHADAELNLATTCQYAEAKAIADGLENALAYIESIEDPEARPKSVQIFTDSMLNYMGLTSWVYGWIKKSVNGVWMATKGPVANQEEFKRSYAAMRKISLMKVSVKFFHINSHESKCNIKKLKNKFEKFNKVKMGEEEFEFIFDQNDACDKAIKLLYRKFVTNNQ